MIFFLAALALVPQPSPKPYVRLFTQVNTADARRINNLPPEEREKAIDDLVRWYVHFHTEHSNEFTLGDPTADAAGVTLAERLAKRGAMVSSYRNGSYVSQAVKGDMNSREAADIERSAPLAISTWWPGPQPDDPAARLTAPIDARAASIEIASPAHRKPEGTPDIWPYMPSRRAGAASGAVFSSNSHDMVSWIRIDREILRVKAVAAAGASMRFMVDRGYFGTTAAPHAAGARVFSPVYIGSAAAVGWDTGLSGSPPVDNPAKPLRYGLKIWEPAALDWIAGRIVATFGAGKAGPYFQGYNAVWLDITSCAAYNNGDAYGRPVNPWDDPHETPMTPDQLGRYQAQKVAGLKARIGPSTGYLPLSWLANNLSGGTTNDGCRNRLLSESVLDGGVLEFWMQKADAWEQQMAQHFLIQANNRPGVYWAKWNQLAKDLTLAQYKRLTYGSLLLAWRPSATRAQYGGPFGLNQPDPLYFWDWGKPAGEPSTLADLAVAACDGGKVYRRDFENGAVLVNPGRQDAECRLETAYWDVTGEPRQVSTVAVKARDAAFLRRVR